MKALMSVGALIGVVGLLMLIGMIFGVDSLEHGPAR